MIRGIVFDKDGTLLDYEKFWIPVAERAIRTLLEAHGAVGRLSAAMHAIGAYDGIRGVLCYGTYDDMMAALLPVFGDTAPTAEAVREAFGAAVAAARIVPTCENLRAVLEELRTRGLRLAVVTSDSGEMTEHCLTALGIADLFDRVFFDDGVHPPKPDPYYMNAFCATYGLAPHEVLMVGDTTVDMRFAARSGAVSVAVGKDAPSLLSGAAHVIPDVSHIFEVLAQEAARG